jgi:hypothetical protein
LIWPLFAVYGFYIALTDGIAKAFVGRLVSEEVSGTAYGVLNTVTSFFTVTASVVGGFLWSVVSPSATFIFAAAAAAVSLAVFIRIGTKE